MTRDTLNDPSTRSWRDIPQPVVPRAMSREGKLRLVMASLRFTAAFGIAAVSIWGGWLVLASARENTRAIPAAAKAVPMKAPELRTDGVLDQAWLVQTLAIPAKTSLLELDLDKLRTRLLAEPQIATATLTKHFPDRLIVTIAERSPVVRVMVQMLGEQRALLVARDGVIYAGEGYDRPTVDSLPWLDGVKIQPAGGGFRPIRGMEIASELLSKGRLEAEHLYTNWSVISLARLESDHRLEVRTKDGRQVVYFSTEDDFFRQLAKLDYIIASLAAQPAEANVTIDLSLGQDVPVMATPIASESAAEPVGRGLRSSPIASSARRTAESAPYHQAVLRSSTAAASRFLATSQPAAESAPQSRQTFFVLPSQTPNTKREL